MFSISTWNLVSNNWTINHIQYNNDNENLKIHIQFTYSKQFNKVQVTFNIKETYLSKHT